MPLAPSIPATNDLLPARVFPRFQGFEHLRPLFGHIRGVIEPDKMLTIQLAGFLTMSVAWLLPTPSLGAQPSWVSPLVGSELINSYLAPANPYGAGHRGVDYGALLGQGVFAPASGTVSFVGKVVDRQVLTLAHEGNVLSSYEPACSSLAVGQKVAAGELVAEVCEPEQNYVPHCETSVCLHFSVRKKGEYMSPLWFTGEISPSVILPWKEPEITI